MNTKSTTDFEWSIRLTLNSNSDFKVGIAADPECCNGRDLGDIDFAIYYDAYDDQIYYGLADDDVSHKVGSEYFLKSAVERHVLENLDIQFKFQSASKELIISVAI